jgi:hypothetical protein
MNKAQTCKAVTVFTAGEMEEYHGDFVDLLPKDAIGYAEISVPNELDYDHQALEEECQKQIRAVFGHGYKLAHGVAEGDDFANNDGLADQDGMWALFAIVKA